jgi:hypothetical protein
MPSPDQIRDALRETLGKDRADALHHDVMERVAIVRRLEHAVDAHRGAALRECTAAIEARLGAVSSRTNKLLEVLGPGALRLIGRLATESDSHEDFHQKLSLVESTVQEAAVIGARRVLERCLERRFGPLTYEWLVAIDAASASELNRCHERLTNSGSIEEVLEPLVGEVLERSAIEAE